MSALEAFDSTWTGARATFGEGVPQRGDEFDNSARLRQLQATVESAAPGDKWQGAAADAYSARNQKYAAVYGALASLDQRVATEVTNAAAVVDAGRRNLETTQNWVRSMAAAIPPGQSAETMRMVLARKGISDIRDVVEQSDRQLNEIGRRIRDLGKEYDALSGQEKPSPAPLTGLGEEKVVPGTPKRPFDGVLTDEEWRIARLSPTLLDQYEQARAQGWTFTSNPGEGTYTRERDKVINIDPALADNGPFQRVNALSHELGHALNNPPLDRSSKDAFVNSRLDGEGAATMNTIKIEREILAAGGPDIIPAAPNDDRFEQIYDAYVQAGSTPESYQSAIRQIGEVYGTLIPSTDPNTTYREYYGRDYK